MKQIDKATYMGLLASASILERDAHGEKVLALNDGTLVKIFRRKRWLSTALIFPYAQRFVRNARILKERGILTVEVLSVACCSPIHRHLVTYRPLPGTTLRQALRDDGSRRVSLLGEFACFVAALHEHGVYFRSLHFGNVIVPPVGSELGLIDIADLSFHRGSLSPRLRTRNFKHMLRYREDIGFLADFGARRFIDCYLDAADLSPREVERFNSSMSDLSVDFSSGG